MSQNNYNIGQIIYILSNKTQSIIPALITEESIRKIKKADGIQEVIDYKLSIGPPNKQTVIDLNRLNGEAYPSLEEIRKVLVHKLTTYVDELIGKTQKDIKDWYGINIDGTTTISNASNNISSEHKIDPERLLDQSYKSNTHSQQLLTNQPISSNNLKENLRALVDPGESVTGQENEKMVILPDGSRIPVSFKE